MAVPFQPAFAAAALAAAFTCSCSTTPEPPKPTPEQAEFGPTGIPPQLRAKPEAQGPAAVQPDGTVVLPGGNKRNLKDLKFTPLEDIVFTNADNPDEQPAELSEILATPKAKIWEESDTIASRRSARDGKPLLIWFTSSKFSPNCRALEQELFSRADFGDWAKEKLVRLKVDSTYRLPPNPDVGIDETKSIELTAKQYAERLKKRYKVNGHPTLVVLNPSGEVICKHSGFQRGQGEFIWGLIKHAEEVSSRSYSAWRGTMEKRGYRDWHDRRERKIFARLVSREKDAIVLIDPNGSRYRTSVDRLSDADREWLETHAPQ